MREHHTATETPFGTVVAGGYRFGALAAVQVFDGTTWRDAPPLLTARYHHAAVAYGGGVLVMGGLSSTDHPLAETEFFDGIRWIRVAPMHTPRAMHAAVLYDSAPVVIGGRFLAPLSTVEVYNGREWLEVTGLGTPRYGHSATVTGGSIRIAGGAGNTGPLRSAETFNGAIWTR